MGEGILFTVVAGGHVDSVKLLVTRGLPAQPFIYENPLLGAQLLSSDQRLCLEIILENGRPIHPMTPIYAAARGDLETVRLLDSKGVELWDYACKEEDVNFHNLDNSPVWARIQREKKVIDIPQSEDRGRRISTALLYGWYRGAPVTPAMEAIFKSNRAATRATLLCFHVATRPSNEGTPVEHRAAWSAMGRVPGDVVEKIITDADCHIKETFRRRHPKSCRASVLDTPPPIMVWMNGEDWLTMIVSWILHVLWTLFQKWLPI